ncbi:MAG: AAA family ATPase [Campylobacterales bacterium]|nr:AAA family ATPase [Campylobacterales bacterium]
MSIKSIRIKNFKSIIDVSIENITTFCVFAGSNGSGKSNIFEALEFIRDVVRSGANEAIKKHNGYENIHSHKLKASNAKKFYAKLVVEINNDNYIYELEIKNFDRLPSLFETVIKNDQEIAKKSIQNNILINENIQDIEYSENETILKLVSKEAKDLLEFLKSIERYQIDPIKAREADDFSASEVLDSSASNISTVLTNLEKNSTIMEEIMEAMQMIVPGLENVFIEKERLNNKSILVFKEENVWKRFPAGLISDGTIYALAMLTIIYSNQKGIVLIEEPERGLNPKAISELIELFRDKSNRVNIFINTHSESVVRVTKANELFLVDKKDGKTEIKNAQKSFPNYDYSKMSIDSMWMSNMFDGGLPW